MRTRGRAFRFVRDNPLARFRLERLGDHLPPFLAAPFSERTGKTFGAGCLLIEVFASSGEYEKRQLKFQENFRVVPR